METCLYKGVEICAYDIVDGNGTLNYELKKEWIIAAKRGELICPECGAKVALKCRDINKKVPHFYHLEDTAICPSKEYDRRESEDHKKGKMLLYTYLKNKYPDEKIVLKYRFPNRRIADLYIEFTNGDKLAVEYQRTSMFITDIEEKNKDYINSGINTLWILNGNEEKVKNKVKQSELAFFEQNMLNEWDSVAKYLDVKSKKIILSKNMKYINPYKENEAYEELYVESYNLQDVHMNTNGEIECSFTKNYAERLINFKDLYKKKCFIEEQERLSALENQRKLMEENKKEREKQLEAVANRKKAFNKHAPYGYKINKALKYDNYGIDSISKYIRERGSSEDDKALRFMFQYHHSKGNPNAIDVYKKTMDKAGIAPLEILNIPLEDLKCPFCCSELTEGYDKYGCFVACSNFRECKLRFNM